MAKKRAKKIETSTNNDLAELLKNAESDPEFYELLKAIKKDYENKKTSNNKEPEVRKTVLKKTTPKAEKTVKKTPRKKQLAITKNTFNPNKFANVGRDPADSALRKQNVIIKTERQVYQPVEVQCSICRRVEEVPQGYITGEYYRCVKCSKT